MRKVVSGGDALAAAGDDVGAGAEDAAMRQCQSFKWCVVDRLQQGLDAMKRSTQIASRFVTASSVIEAGAEIGPGASMIGGSRVPSVAAYSTASSSASTSDADSALAFCARFSVSRVT
jgi:hypothetical protein